MKKVMLLVLSFLIMCGAASALTVTASSFQAPNKPENVIDGDFDTRWSCQGECWIQVDLGEVGDGYRELWVTWRNTATRVATFDIAVSVDGSRWTTVFSGTSDDRVEESAGEELARYDFGDWYTLRYIRLIGYGNSFNNWNSVYEMYPLDPDEGTWVEREIELVSASHYEKANTPQMVLDGNLATHWTADTPAWIQFKLGDGIFDPTEGGPVDKVKIAWKSGNKRVANFDIQISGDGTNWETVFSGKSSGRSLALETYLIEGVCARYVRIVGKGNSDPKQAIKNSIAEVEIWGFDFFGSGSC